MSSTTGDRLSLHTLCAHSQIVGRSTNVDWLQSLRSQSLHLVARLAIHPDRHLSITAFDESIQDRSDLRDFIHVGSGSGNACLASTIHFLPLLRAKKKRS